MTPQEEQDFLDDRLGGEVCDDCSNDADAHAVGLGPSGPFIDCTDD
ncbi:hypothetical protein [Streptomyces tauricus]